MGDASVDIAYKMYKLYVLETRILTHAFSGEEVFAQGAISIGNDMVAVGASSGRILIFKKDSGTFAWADTLQGDYFKTL